MSVLRDAMGLGYGADHFMVTGEDFPSEWEDETNTYADYDDDGENEHTEPETTKEPSSLDTEEGWIKRKYVINYNVEPVGIMDGVSYYHLNQTFPFNKIMEAGTVDFIREHLNKIQDYIIHNNCTTERDLDSEYYYIKCAIIDQIDYAYKLLKENPGFIKYYIVSESDNDIPF